MSTRSPLSHHNEARKTGREGATPTSLESEFTAPEGRTDDEGKRGEGGEEERAFGRKAGLQDSLFAIIDNQRGGGLHRQMSSHIYTFPPSTPACSSKGLERGERKLLLESQTSHDPVEDCQAPEEEKEEAPGGGLNDGVVTAAEKRPCRSVVLRVFVDHSVQRKKKKKILMMMMMMMTGMAGVLLELELACEGERGGGCTKKSPPPPNHRSTPDTRFVRSTKGAAGKKPSSRLHLPPAVPRVAVKNLTSRGRRGEKIFLLSSDAASEVRRRSRVG